MEQEERDGYVKKYREDSAEPRRIMAAFHARVVTELAGPQAKEWLKALDLLAKIEHPTQKLFDVLEKLLSKPSGDLFTLTVDYSRSVSDGIRVGRYDYANSDITARHFPTNKSGVHEVRVELLHFDRGISTENALRKIGTQGYRPADIHELLALGEKYPEIQREFPVVALGSVWQGRDGDRLVPCLHGGGASRHLNLGWHDYDWGAVFRFLVVRK